jgi:hypothetical protein
MVFSILLGILSLLASAYVIGNGSFVFPDMPFVIFVVVAFGMLFGGYAFVFAPLQPDWKAESSKKLIFMWKAIDWNISIFQGLSNKRLDYLNLLTEELMNIGFQRIGEIHARFWGEDRYFKGSDLIFESPDEMYVGVRAVGVGNDLRVGLNASGKTTTKTKLKAWGGLGLSILIAFIVCVLSIYILGYMTGNAVPYPPDVPAWMIFIPVVIFFSVLLPTFYIFMKRLVPELFSLIKKILLKIGESMGPKQIVPFKRIYSRYD